ncbi:Ig-like domain repeat protein [Sulfuracidifex tepidarius]|uniref:Uncharacterized protein n=1 Tax=Sulfuracidifex tepidarius TaxID=1294262 RepID=A0A510E5L8_9CREN|nr:Ig-like domain repeat protein [Sulfuracidifex tepidarius]BBG27804.1 hypothetical protein IC007_2358 [Sulfuracidifex tepidarius]
MKRSLTIFIIILLTPSLLGGIGNIVTIAQTGNGITVGNFISTLYDIIPPLLLLLAILANRYDQRYALVLFAASLASALFLAAAGKTTIPGIYTPGNITYIQLNIKGPSTIYIGQTGTWTISGANVTPQWYIMNVSNGVKIASGSGTLISWNDISPGKYVIVATYIGNSTNSSSIICAYGNFVFNSQYPPSSLGWIQEAIESAFQDLINTVVGGFSLIGSFVSSNIVPINDFVYSPTTNAFTISIYFKIEELMTGLAMLLIAASIAYNAFRGFYYDLIDLARDVLYKLGVWGLFTSGGLTIYDYAAGFINYLINVTVGPYLNAIAGEMLTSIASFWALFAASNVIGFDFASALRQYATDVVLFYSIFVGLAFVRYAILLAAVSLIPLAATLWIFEWTRPIAGIIVDLIVGLMASGIIAAITFALLEQMGIGIIIFLAGPIIGGVEFAVTLFLTFTSLKPHQHIAGLTRRVGGGSDGGGTQPPSPQPQSPQAPSQPEPRERNPSPYM